MKGTSPIEPKGSGRRHAQIAGYTNLAICLDFYCNILYNFLDVIFSVLGGQI